MSNTIDLNIVFNQFDEKLRVFLINIFQPIIESLPIEKVKSIVLIGSTARGELSYKFANNNLDIYSDIEFLIVTKSAFSKVEKEVLHKSIKDIEESLMIKSPLFYLDYGIISYNRIINSPPTLWTFELIEFGKIIYGDNVCKSIKTVNIINLDFGNLNELIIVRLWNMLLHINEKYILGNASIYEKNIIRFYYARNILDVLTILLPHNNHLVGGYKNRQIIFEEQFKNVKWLDEKENFREALNLKLNSNSNKNLHFFQQTFFNGFLKLVQDIAKLPDNNEIDLFYKRSRSLENSNFFKESFIKRIRALYIKYLVFSKHYDYNYKYLSILRNNRLRVLLMNLLFYMHKFLIESKLLQKQQLLKKSFLIINQISPNKKIYIDVDKSLEVNFIRLRTALLEFMLIWMYGRSNITKDELTKFTNWKKDE